jgi:FixJ family two-component response regulator
MAFTIFLVDDNPGVLKALSRRLRVKGYDVEAFSSPLEFLAQHNPAVPGCAVLDVAMPNLDGLALQETLLTHGVGRPVIFITGQGTIPTSVRAMKAGALDFLTKPVDDDDLFDAIARAEQKDSETRRRQGEIAEIRARLATLTPREREVLAHVIAGRLNKQIAGDLGTVEQTIKVHRSRMMEKLGVRSMVGLMRLMAKVEAQEPTRALRVAD